MREDETAEVNSVYNRAYGNIRSNDYFKWEFINGPWGKAIYVLAEDLEKEENKIIGTQSAIPIVFTDGKGNKILTAKSEDTFVHPDYRGHKLFEKMYDLLFEECKNAGIQYIWGFTYARKPFLKLGFEIPFETLQGIFINRPLKAYKYLSGLNSSNSSGTRLKILGLCFLSKLKVIIRNILNGFQRSTYNINRSKKFNKELLINSILNSNPGLWTMDQKEEYINWRIENNPYPNNFENVSVFENDSEIYLANFLFNSREKGYVYLEEILFDKSVSVSESVLMVSNSLKMIIVSSQPALIRFWGFDTNTITTSEISILKKSGFKFVKKGTAFVWKVLDNDSNKKIEPENLLLSRLFTQGNR